MMKKTILAIAIPAVVFGAGAANASVSLYNTDGVSVDLSGAAEIQYLKNYATTKDAYIRIDDADLLFMTSVQITEGLSAISGIGFKYESDLNDSNNFTNDESGTTNDELYVGLSSNFGTLTFGRQLLISDDMGNAKDHELGTAQIGVQTSAASQVAKWVYDQGIFYAGFNVSLDQAVSSAVDGRQIVGGRLGVRPAPGLDMRIYYYDGQNFEGKENGVDYKLDQTVYNFEVDYNIGMFDVAASFGNRENSKYFVGGMSEKVSTDFWQISGGYKLDERTSVAIGLDVENGDGSEVMSYYTNVNYQLHNNAKIYVEIGNEDRKTIDTTTGAKTDDPTDFGYLIGMEVKF